MCGIAGWCGAPLPQARLEAATRLLRHRGPDGEGVWTGEGVGLGHRRLAIIDLSPTGAQPMATADEELRVTFNGEIYNFRELRRELEGRAEFRSQSDTEVLLHGYRAWGIDGLLRRANGMFAFALWDHPRRLLHLARDRVGKKPLYYVCEDGRIAFASTLPALLALRTRAPEVDPGAVVDFLQHLCVPGEQSILRDVRRLPPATRGEWHAGTLRLERYWTLGADQQEDRPEEEWLEQIDGQLGAAVRDRLESEVPLGVFLSGGVDSSLVAAKMVQVASRPVIAISAGFDEQAHSELHHARRVASHLGVEHHEHIIRPAAAGLLPRLVHAAGEPFADQAALPTMLLAEAAREHVIVVLTGDGGDEGFGGYPSVLAARAAAIWQQVLPGPLRSGAARLLGRGIGARGPRALRVLRRMVLPGRGARDLVWEYDPLGERGLRGRLETLIAPGLLRELPDPDRHWRAAFLAARGPTVMDRVMLAEIATLLPDQFLVKTDLATMAHGVEARSPFLDWRILELAMRIPARMRLRGWRTKHLLRRLAVRYVPRDVIERRKQGFSVPMSSWIRGPLAPVINEILLDGQIDRRGLYAPGAVAGLVRDHRAGTADHGQQLWALMVLELWMRIFLDGTMSATDRLVVGQAGSRA